MTSDPNRPVAYDRLDQPIDTTADQAHAAVDKAEQAASDVVDRAQQVADEARLKARQAADRADAATTAAGEKLTDVAQTIREKAPAAGPAADAASSAAGMLERAGTYLQRQDLAGMRADLEAVIRRRPIESLLVGLGIGYLLARRTRR